MLPLTVVAFALSLWLGMYLLARDPRRPLLRAAGLGLVAYSLGLAVEMLAGAPGGVARPLETAREFLLWLPPLFWIAALIELLPGDEEWRARLRHLWRVAAGLLLLAAPLWLMRGGLAPLILLLVGASLLGLLLFLRQMWKQGRGRGVLAVVVVATLFFSLGTAMLFLPLGLPRTLVIPAIGLDLLVLGAAIAWWDAFDLGERVLPDMVRSFDAALLLSLFLGLQVVAAMAWSTGVTFPMLLLLLATIASGIALSTFGEHLQFWLDAIAFSVFPASGEMRQERELLRTAAGVLPRQQAHLALLDDEEALTRHTRRALSDYGNLARLVKSPLTRLPIVDERLRARNAPDHPLERAQELKRLLAESIERLKPPEGEFGTTDEWRYYNALYFPYVVGLRPYSRRATHDDLDTIESDALAWLREQVPPRTPYNWQATAAELIARDLRAQHRPA